MARVTWLSCILAAVAWLLLAAAGPTYRLGLLSIPNAFVLLRWGAYLGLAAMAAAAIAGVWAYRRGARVRMILPGVALVAGLVAFGIPYQWQRTARRVPPIHDITTDLENPPTFEAVVPIRADAPNRLDRPAELARQQREGYPDLAPITLPAASDQVFDRALAVAQDLGWEIVTADKSTGRIEATDTTRWFGFRDDVVVRLTPWGSGTRVDVRSVSRVGRSDVGTNARRIRRYLEALRNS
ncbi:MAG: DUF1499 domain-containing protein [Acidobacteria bacterium]|nr:DUF1499 domain-containing protein [Acidobacteriota bacterium]